jgi:hypothetical protein
VYSRSTMGDCRVEAATATRSCSRARLTVQASCTSPASQQCEATFSSATLRNSAKRVPSLLKEGRLLRQLPFLLVVEPACGGKLPLCARFGSGKEIQVAQARRGRGLASCAHGVFASATRTASSARAGATQGQAHDAVVPVLGPRIWSPSVGPGGTRTPTTKRPLGLSDHARKTQWPYLLCPGGQGGSGGWGGG